MTIAQVPAEGLTSRPALPIYGGLETKARFLRGQSQDSLLKESADIE